MIEYHIVETVKDDVAVINGLAADISSPSCSKIHISGRYHFIYFFLSILA